MADLTHSDMVRISKMLSKTLRHNPGRVGIRLDKAGWVSINELLAAFAAHGQSITRAELDYVVEHNDKRRFAVEGEQIRASQGHSIDIDLGLAPATPPTVLYHGTTAAAVASILAMGIDRGSRTHVHLSLDTETARRVGGRHGQPVVLTVLAEQMAAAGATFFLSANEVWLTKVVPPKYVQVTDHWTASTPKGKTR